MAKGSAQPTITVFITCPICFGEVGDGDEVIRNIYALYIYTSLLGSGLICCRHCSKSEGGSFRQSFFFFLSLFIYCGAGILWFRSVANFAAGKQDFGKIKCRWWTSPGRNYVCLHLLQFNMRSNGDVLHLKSKLAIDYAVKL